MDAFFDISGWAALLVLMPATWMQVWKNWQRKSTDGVSMRTFVHLGVGLGLLLLLSLARETPLQIQINYALGTVGAAAVLLQHLYFNHAGKREGE
ncbi:MAG: hypothetical protein A2932_02125 [Candidatus Spechtbacteria bacterium RIFCSPLOWO2_01_FULL_46_10]|uniref:Uncharacterized protein n=1 Tax=Candidatus Spechtbacteria bacterium RIFCSPLOWO2_01_FULL_46_10 TaxID=1802163 RepID=A0A1G2HFN2_9BACT|nr:MAG: hypothetical protein A2932_02125 [Candidatus Spechtbacteria bacterium RIFCSPLOWO2_01_FULL_46_10]